MADNQSTDPTTQFLNALASISQGQQQVGGAIGSFSQMLKDRRNFVNSTENGMKDSALNVINNGSNGTAVDPIATIGPYSQYVSDNENKTNALLNQLGQLTQTYYNMNGQKTDAANGMGNYQNNAAQTGINAQNTNLGFLQGGFQPPYGGTGGNGSGNGSASSNTPNTLVETTAQNVASGKLDPNQINAPGNLKQQILQRAYQLGYDPAKDVNGLVDGLESKLFPKQGGTIVQGNDPWTSLLNGLGMATDDLSHGVFKAGHDNITNYQDYAKQVSPVLMEKLGITPDAIPPITDSKETAKNKIAVLRKAISDKFYQGGQLPGKQTADPLGILGGK